MTTFRSHQKQFVLGPEPVRVRPDWISFQLADRVVLSCCPKLRATRLRSLDGKEYFLLGVAVLADVPATIPELFQTKSSSEIVLVPYEEAYRDEGFEDMPRRIPDVSKLERVTGFRCETPLERIVDDVIEDQRARLASEPAAR